ncbi:MAG TPA: VWA domain-containing protein [Bryobacteraceae bacterium]|nr:VWA domain-containing protein [Bryobacteraceae bacterium]
MTFRRLLLLSAITGALAATEPGEVRIRGGAWQPPPARISVETNLVEIGVTVRDHKGNPVDGLVVSDFQVLDDGKVVPVTFFNENKPHVSSASGVSETRPGTAAVSAPSADPRSLALYFDDTRTEPFGLNRAKAAAEKLVSHLQPGDLVGIFTATGSVTEDLTDNPAHLLTALSHLRVHPQSGSQGIGICPTLTRYQAYGIISRSDLGANNVALREAIACNCLAGDADCPRRQEGVVQSAAQSVWEQTQIENEVALDTLAVVLRHLATAPGKRILLWMSPGFPSGAMDRPIDRLIDLAVRNRIVVNSLDSSGLASFSPEVLNTRDGTRYEWAQRTMNLRQMTLTGVMASLSPATGGQLVVNTNDFDTAIRSLTTPTEAMYMLGIAPTSATDDQYHSLKVMLRRSGSYKIESRAGYFATVPEKQPERPPAKAETPQERIDRVAISKDSLQDFPATVEVSGAPASDGQLNIKVITTVDAKGLVFEEKEAHHRQQLTFVTLLEDSAGAFVAGKQAVMDLALSDGTLEDLRARGIRTSTSFTAPPGTYVVRTVVREATKDGLAAARTPLGNPRK